MTDILPSSTEVRNYPTKVGYSDKKPLPLPLVVLILLGVIAILVLGTIKVAMEERDFVNQCNAFWQGQIETLYPASINPSAPLVNWNATPGKLSGVVIGVAEKTGLASPTPSPPQNQTLD